MFFFNSELNFFLNKSVRKKLEKTILKKKIEKKCWKDFFFTFKDFLKIF